MTRRLDDAHQKRRIVFVNRFYLPDFSATSQILTDIAENLAASGYDICVYTSRMSYDGANRFEPFEILHSVKVYRIWSTRFGRKNTFGRVCDYLTFYVSSCWRLLWALKKSDILVVKTDPPMISVPLAFVARLRKAQLVNWLQDLFPEVAQKLDIGPSDGFLMRSLKWLRNRSLSQASTNVVIGQRMKTELEKNGVPASRVVAIPNFANDEMIVARSHHSLDLRRKWSISPEDFVIGYSGNLGRAHDLETMLDVAESVRDLQDIKFLFVGGGHLHNTLASELETRRLSNVLLRPYQPRDRLPESLALPDLHWASLHPALEGYIVPSKFYGIAAAGRPLLMIGDPKGEIGAQVSDYKFGLCVRPGEHEKARRFVLELRDNAEKCEALGKNARKFLDRQSSRSASFKAWDDLFRRLSARN